MTDGGLLGLKFVILTTDLVITVVTPSLMHATTGVLQCWKVLQPPTTNGLNYIKCIHKYFSGLRLCTMYIRLHTQHIQQLKHFNPPFSAPHQGSEPSCSFASFVSDV